MNSVDLWMGDCLDLLGAYREKLDVALVLDPPYGIAYSSGYGSSEWGDGAVAGDKDTAVRDAALALVGDVPALVFGSWKVARPVGTKMLLVWDTLGALGMGDLRLPWKPSHQEIYVLGRSSGFTGKRGSDIIQHPPVQSMAKNGRLHPMEKPVGLLMKLIAKLKASTIIDPFMGSGATGEAAIKMGRNFVGCEIDPGYFAIAEKRLADAQAQLPLFALEAQP